MPGILDGNTFSERLTSPTFLSDLLSGKAAQKLNAFLTQSVPQVRQVFNGKLTYASFTLEGVDWNLFDYVGLDHSL